MGFEHKQVCAYIRSWVEENVRNHIANDTNFKVVREKFENMYASKTGNNKLFCLERIIELRYEEGNTIMDYVNEFQGVVDQLPNLGVKFEDEILGL